MIRINLLPKQKRVKVSNVEKEIFLFLLLITLCLIGVIGVDQWMSNRVESIQREVSSKTQIRNTLLKKIKKVKEIKKELTEIQEKIKIIKDIRIRQGLPVRYIDEIVNPLPADKIWFTALRMNQKGDISIQGISLDNQAFAKYVNDLRKSSYIASVTTKKTSKKEIKGLGLIEFDFSIAATKPKEGA